MRHYCNKQKTNHQGTSQHSVSNTNKPLSSTLKDNNSNQSKCKAVKSAEDNKRRLNQDNFDNETHGNSTQDISDNSSDDTDAVIIPPGCSREYMVEYLDSNDISVKVYEKEEVNNTYDDICDDNICNAETNISDSKCNNAYSDKITEKSKYFYHPKQNMPSGFVKSEIKQADINTADNMRGKYNFLSVPENACSQPGEKSNVSLAMYLNNYLGKFICIDLWTVNQNRIEKCGTLTDVGKDFIGIKNSRGNIMLIDLKSVRYISIFCR